MLAQTIGKAGADVGESVDGLEVGGAVGVARGGVVDGVGIGFLLGVPDVLESGFAEVEQAASDEQEGQEDGDDQQQLDLGGAAAAAGMTKFEIRNSKQIRISNVRMTET